MYISEISGHHSATLAIENAIKILQPDAEVLNLNAFNYTNPASEKFINRLYLGVIKKTPRIWNYLYDNPKVKKKIERFKDMIHRMNSPKLKALFDRFNPGAVACTQAFPCGMVADFKTTYNSDIPLMAVLTDYIPHSYWIYDAVDYYIAPCQELKLGLIKKKVAAERIKIYGIPFESKFNQPVDRKKVMEKLGLAENLPVILIMGGGQGIGPIKTIINSLDKSRADFQEIIITGINNKLYKSIKKRLNRYRKKLVLLEFVNNVAELMAVSNLLITKPGGITIAEALGKHLPIVIIKPIPGQEESNTIYLTNKGVALRVDNPRKINRVLEDLLRNPDKLSRMSDSASKISKPNSALDIAKLLLELCNKDGI